MFISLKFLISDYSMQQENCCNLLALAQVLFDLSSDSEFFSLALQVVIFP